MTEQESEREPVEEQREDGIVLEPGGGLARDLQRHGLEPGNDGEPT